MLLAIDAGNSTINVGLFGEEKKRTGGRPGTSSAWT